MRKTVKEWFKKQELKFYQAVTWKRTSEEEGRIIHKFYNNTTRFFKNQIKEALTTSNQTAINDKIQNIKDGLNSNEKSILQELQYIYKLYALVASVCLLLFYFYLDEIILFNFKLSVRIIKDPASFVLIYELTNVMFIIVSILLFIIAYYDSKKLKYILKKSKSLSIQSKLKLLYFTVFQIKFLFLINSQIL